MRPMELTEFEIRQVAGGDALSSGIKGTFNGAGVGGAAGAWGAVAAGVNGARWGTIGGIAGAAVGAVIGVAVYYY